MACGLGQQEESKLSNLASNWEMLRQKTHNLGDNIFFE
jgi:hypothetical protein